MASILVLVHGAQVNDPHIQHWLDTWTTIKFAQSEWNQWFYYHHTTYEYSLILAVVETTLQSRYIPVTSLMNLNKTKPL
jgi:hypothetical protein